jgi:nucleoid DNA-binding protein
VVSETIQKRELCRQIGQRTGVRQVDVKIVLDTLASVVFETCVEGGGRVVMHSFGTFEMRKHGGRSYKHPVGGETLRSKPSEKLYFRRSKCMKG